MKKILGLVFLMLILISSTEFTSSKLQTNADSLEGTWELVNRFKQCNGYHFKHEWIPTNKNV